MPVGAGGTLAEKSLVFLWVKLQSHFRVTH
jgi:hypothetical protein